jgi:hypothetical protein
LEDVMFRSALAMVVLVLASSVAWAQQPQPPLGDVAKKEAERRKATPTPTKVYTNADVKARPITTATARADEPQKDAAAAGTTPAAAGTTAAAAAQQPARAATTPEAATAEAETRDEAWWRKRMTEIRDSLNRHRVLAEALQSRINALWADFTARDDPAQRGVIEANRREALAELDRVKMEILRQQQAMADLEEEARRAGVPPGWLR